MSASVQIKRPERCWGDVLYNRRNIGNRNKWDAHALASRIGVGVAKLYAWEAGAEYPKSEERARLYQLMPDMRGHDPRLTAELAAYRIKMAEVPPPAQIVIKLPVPTPAPAAPPPTSEDTIMAAPVSAPSPDAIRSAFRLSNIINRLGAAKNATAIIEMVEMMKATHMPADDIIQALKDAREASEAS